MLDFVTALPDAREGVRRLSQVLSGIVVNTRMSEVRKGSTHSFTSAGSFSNPRLLSSDDAQLAQESIDRLAALIALGPRRAADAAASGGGGDASTGASPPGDTSSADGGGPIPSSSPSPGLEGLPEDQAEQYLTEMYDMLLKCRVPEALGELTAMAASALLGGPITRPPPAAGGGGGGAYAHDEASSHDEAMRRRSVDLRASLDMYVRDGGPSPARASIEGLLCSQKLGGHAQALLESICQLLLSCVFDPIWRHRDLLAQPRVRELIVALSCSSMLPALSSVCVKLRQLLARPASLEAASHAWLLGFVAKSFTGLCRSMKAMVEFESCAALWAQLGDAFAAQLAVTRLVERFSATAAAVHPSYQTWRLPPPPGTPVDVGSLGAGPAGGVGAGGPGGAAAGAAGGAAARPGETYLELCAAVEVFLEGLFHLTWHFTARTEEAAAAGPPPPLLVRDVLAAMEPEGSGSVAALLAAAAAASAADVRSGALVPLASLLGGSGTSSAAASAWPALVSGPATHCLVADWLAHLVARLDGGEALTGHAGLAPAVAASAPLLHRPGPVDRDELPLLLSVCLAVAAAGAPAYIANGGPTALRGGGGGPSMQPTHQQPRSNRGRRGSIELLFGGGGGGGGGDAGGDRREGEAEAVSSEAVKHASRMLRLVARGLKAMAATQDAELAPYPAIHSAHSCAVAMHKILQDESAAQARLTPGGAEWNASAMNPAVSTATATANGGGAWGGDGRAGPLFGSYVPPPPQHTALLLDSFQAALMCYSAFLHPDPDKDPLTLRAVERCHEQLLELCTATGQELRMGVAAVVYAAHAGLLPALEAVLRAAALTCRLEAVRVLLTAVLSSLPALQQLNLSRDGYLFLTLRKLIIACVNLACPHPLEYPMPAVQPPNSRRSLTLILQQCNSTAANANSNSQQSNGQPLSGGRNWVPDHVAYGTQPPASDAAAAGGRASQDSTGGRSTGRSSGSHGGALHGHGQQYASSASSSVSGRPLILPLAVELLDTVSMLSRRFIEVHEGRVAAAANIRMDAAGNVMRDRADDDYPSDGANGYTDEGEGADEEEEDEGEGAEELAEGEGEGGEGRWRRRRRSSAATTAARRRRSFEREATELLPLAQLLPFALWWLAAPASDLVDALAQEVINDDDSGSLFGDTGGGSGGAAGGGSDGGAAHRSHHPRANSRANSQHQLTLPPSDGRRGSIELQRQPSTPAAAAAQQQQQYSKSDLRRRQSIDLSRASPLSGRAVARGGVMDSLGGGGGGADVAAPVPPPSLSAWGAVASSCGGGGGAVSGGGGDRSWVVLSRCADTLHTLFRLMVAMSDLNRRAPHPDWPELIASLQPQQLLARAVQLLVHGVQRQRQQAAAPDSNGYSYGYGGRSSRARGPAFPVLLSSLLSASVCGVQYGWLVPESFGIPSAHVDPAELERLQLSGGGGAAVLPPPPPASASSVGPVQGPLFSRIRRFTVISANPEGRAYQWAMIGDEEEDGGGEGLGPDGVDPEGDSSEPAASEDEGVEGKGGGRAQPRPVVLLQAATPGGAWSSLPPPPGPAVVPTRALQVLVSEYGSAADKVLFDLLLRGLSSKRNNKTAASAASAADGSTSPSSAPQFFWVPPSRSSSVRTCSNPCCMNLSGLQEAQLRLAACPRCGGEWYCSRHCQAMHWHAGHKATCCGRAAGAGAGGGGGK